MPKERLSYSRYVVQCAVTLGGCMSETFTSLRSELTHFWRIGWPLLVAQSAQMGTGVVDTIMAARFGDKDLAAIAIGFNIWLPLYLVVLGVMFLGPVLRSSRRTSALGEYIEFATTCHRRCGCLFSLA